MSDEDKGQDDGKVSMNDIVRGLIHENVLKRKMYDDLVDDKKGNPEFMKIVARHMASLKIDAVKVTVPADYAHVEIYYDAELGQIALHEGLLIFMTEEIKGDSKIKRSHVIDHEKKILYSNTSRKVE
jgi:hypothetical protein